jgi:nitrous oxidase accessory protein NosD
MLVAAGVSLGVASGCGAQVAPAKRATSQVATPETFGAKLKAAQPGDVIVLGDGDFGKLELYGSKIAKPGVRIEAKQGAKAVFRGISLENSEGFEIRDVTVEVNGPWSVGVNVQSSSNITLAGLTVQGTTAADEGRGIVVRDSTGVTVTGSDFSRVGSGIGHSNSHDLKITDNNIHNLENDGIYGGGSNHVVVSGNHIQDFHPQPGDHPDAIQFFASSTGVPGDDVTITDNVITRGAGDVIQGIFIENTDHMVITGNAMSGTMFNGISLITAREVLVANNFVQGYPDMESRIVTRGSTNVTVTGNTAEVITSPETPGVPNPGYKQGPNKTIHGAKMGDTTAMNAWIAQRQPR